MAIDMAYLQDRFRQMANPPELEQRMDNSGQSRLRESLQGQIDNKEKLRRIKIKHGVPQRPLQAPSVQWAGDNNG